MLYRALNNLNYYRNFKDFTAGGSLCAKASTQTALEPLEYSEQYYHH